MLQRDTLINLFLVFVAIIFSLLLAEVLLLGLNIEEMPNILCAYSNDPATGHVLMPGLSGRFVFPPEIDMNFSINSLGARGPEPNDNLQKIVLVGDSMSFGYATNLEDSFAWVTSKAIESSGYEIINYSTPGYGVLRETIILERALDNFNPKTVIFGITLANDWSDNYSFAKEQKKFAVDESHCLTSAQSTSIIDDAKKLIYRHSRLARLVNNYFRNKNPIQTSTNSLARYAIQENETVKEARAITKDAFKNIKKISEEKKFNVVLLLIPSRIGVDENLFVTEIQKIGSLSDYYRNRERDNYLDICAENNFTCLDSKPFFEEKINSGIPSSTFYNTKIDHHLTAEGNEILAEILIEYFSKNLSIN